MTEQTNAELIAAGEEFRGTGEPYEDLIVDLAARLKASERRATEAISQRNHARRQRDEEREAKSGNIRALNQACEDRDSLAAAVKKVRELPRYRVPDPVMTWSAVDSEDLDHALATAPTDALREHDAALIEAYQSQIRSTIGAFGDADGVWAFDSAVKTIEEARQRREERV